MSSIGAVFAIGLLTITFSFTFSSRSLKSPGYSKQSRYVTNSYYNRNGCWRRNCPGGYVCERRRSLYRPPRPACHLNVREAISTRLNQWNVAWNAQDFQALEAFYTTESVFLPPGAPIRRGNAGFAEFIGGLVQANNWGRGTWTLDQLEYVTEDLVTSVDRFVIDSSVGEATTFGKEVALWKLVHGVYKLQYEAINFDG